MSNFWLKLKVWTKVIVFVLLLLFVLVFAVQNMNKPVTVWLWNDIQTTLLMVLLVTVLISVIGTLLIRTAFATIQQIKEMRQRTREQRLEREVSEMKTKAAMLQQNQAREARERQPERSVEREEE